MDISSLMIAVFDLDSWNLVPKTGLTQGIQFWNQKLRILKMTFRKRQIEVFKIGKNGSSEKNRCYQQSWSEIVIFWLVDPILGTKFHESRSKTGIIREEMSIFKSPCRQILLIVGQWFWMWHSFFIKLKFCSTVKLASIGSTFRISIF